MSYLLSSPVGRNPVADTTGLPNTTIPVPTATSPDGGTGIFLSYLTPDTGWSGATPFRPILVSVQHNALDPTPTQNVSQGIYSRVLFGDATHAALGTSHCYSAAYIVTNSGNAGNEHANYFGYHRNEATTNPGRLWFTDFGAHGPVGVQPSLLTGINLAFNNYYNGSPSSSESYALGLYTRSRVGAGVGPSQPLHYNADTFPVDNAIQILGTSGPAASPTTGQGFRRAIKLGRSGTGWSIGSSWFGTGIEINDYESFGILIQNRRAEAAAGAPAIAVVGGNGPVIVGGNSLTNAASLLEVKNPALTISDPLVNFTAPDSTSFSLRISNTTGSLKLGVVGSANNFLTGTAAGDGVVLPVTAGKAVHMGGSTKIFTVTASDTLAFFGKTPVAQQTGGVLTAAATYGANEQTMLQRVYDAVRNVGIMA